MPKPANAAQRYMPGLDGLRAVAVLAVIAYHEQFGWAPGGNLGVAIFFTLSGYLITDLLLDEWAAENKIKLKDFWLRRARRLLPALFVMLAVVTAWVTIADRARLLSLRGTDGAAATYWSNWYLIVEHQSYFARFTAPQPLDHLWSLAVEEQFYLIWPWLLLAGLLAVRGLRGSRVQWLLIPTLLLATASAVEMALLYQPGFDPTRVYEGTDTRAFGLLIGAALAMAWPSRGRGNAGRRTRFLLDSAAIGGLVVIGVMIWRVGEYSSFSYRGGMVLLSFATAAVVAATAVPGCLVGRALGWRPLRWIGVRSYGIYLWHYPVIVLTSPANSVEDLPRAAWQIAASVLLAALSWKFIEEPIRHGALKRNWDQARAAHWRIRSARAGVLAATASGTAVLVLACAGLAGAFPVAAPALAQPSGTAATPWISVGTPAGAMAPLPGPRLTVLGHRAITAKSDAATALKTSCRSVVHIGDSTSEGMILPAYLPDASQRLPAQYHRVGVKRVILEISGARSIVEVLPGQVNGYNVMRGLVSHGYHGCWVIALGTNDTANVAVGSTVGLVARIREMMSEARGEPVMWVNVISLLNSGPYAEPNMRKWDQTLLQACARYPNMRVFNWAAVAQRRWFISDGIHYTSAGYLARGHMIAQALAEAFPASGAHTNCLVNAPQPAS